MSVQDSLFIAVQTLVSNGFGASVGLEAAYAQLGGGLASRVGVWLSLRRADLRILVGAGAGAAIAAAFGAPLTGAFYAFEVIIGSYTVASMAPVAVAALAAALVARASGESIYAMAPETFAGPLGPGAYALYALLGLICAGCGIGVMRLAGAMDILAGRLALPRWARPAIGGVLLMGLGPVSPRLQTLSSGHGALRGVIWPCPWRSKMLLMLIAPEGRGFHRVAGLRLSQAGLFFASLFLGSLVGRAYGLLILRSRGRDGVLDPGRRGPW